MKRSMRRGWCAGATVLAGLLVLGVPACHDQKPPLAEPNAEAAGPPLFEDATAASGVAFTYRNGQEAGHYAILESLGGGLALIDYDGDGLLDLFLPGGGSFTGPDKKQICGWPCRLYKNLGGWRFKDVTR